MNKEYKLALEDFLNYLDVERNLSITTIEGYISDLSVFGEFLSEFVFEQKWSLSDIQPKHAGSQS